MLYDHIDFRVGSLAQNRRLYDAVFRELGYGDLSEFEDGVCYYHTSGDRSLPFFALLLDENHRANGTRVALRVASRAAVDRVADAAIREGASAFEPPQFCPEYSERYYATFFEDADGNKLEVCCRDVTQ